MAFNCVRMMGVAAILTAVTLVGCGKSAGNAADTNKPDLNVEHHTHEGWWCDEHGVPEEVCALCNTKLVAKFKADGDWCKEHDRPDSQCFKCHPDLKAKFAAAYEAKYGKKPPEPTDG